MFQLIWMTQTFCSMLSQSSAEKYLSFKFLFDILRSMILKPRDKTTWRSCYSEILVDSEGTSTSLHKMISTALTSLPTSMQHISRVTSADNSRFASPPLSPSPRSPVWEAEEETSSPVFTIDTNFDFSEPANKSTSDRYTHKNKRSCYLYMQCQRHYADNTTLATSLADFKKKVYLTSLLC